MGILNSIFGGADPSRDWPLPKITDVALDLRQKSICGVRLGLPATDIERIGKPANRHLFKAQQFEYPDHGLILGVEEGMLVDVQMVIVADEHDRVLGSPCVLALPNGSQREVLESTRWADIAPMLPAPYRADHDEEEHRYCVALDRHRLDVECSPDDCIRRLNYYRD